MKALVVGASSYAGRHALQAFEGARGVDPDDDLESATEGVEVVVMCGPTWEPDHKPAGGQTPHPLLARVLGAARGAGVQRWVHLSTAAVYGPDHVGRVAENAPPRPVHSYEKLKLREEEWLRLNRAHLDVIVVRAAAGFGGYDPILERLLRQLRAGTLRLVNGGRAERTFLAGPDLGRALHAAAVRGRAGATYLTGGFDGTWRDLLMMAAAVMAIPARIGSIPYDLAYVDAAVRWVRARGGEECWPNLYGLDMLAKNHVYDDASSRRDLSWSPQVGSFDEGVMELVNWFQRRRHVAEPPGAEETLAISPQDT